MPKFEPFLTNLPLIHQGKVRDTFQLSGHSDKLLQVVTDRVSTHNIVHKSIIPEKGVALTVITAFWAGILDACGIPHHIIAVGRDIERFLPHGDYPDNLFRRTLVVRRCGVIPYEFIWRSRMGGSLLDAFYSKGIPNPYGITVPEGLQLMSPFSEPIFTPTDKSETDEPVSSAQIMTQFTDAVRLTADVYAIGSQRLRASGIDLIDGKFEVGRDEDGRTLLIDEWLTPDCCRMVREESVVIGQNPPWLDKEIVRAAAMAAWGKGPKHPLIFSEEVIRQTQRAYKDLVKMITGEDMDWLKNNL